MDKTKLKGVAALIAAAVAVILAAFLCMSFPMAEVQAAEAAGVQEAAVYAAAADTGTTEKTEASVASVTSGGETKYYTVLRQAFMDAKDGDTVTLLADVTVDTAITVDKAVTISGKGADGNYTVSTSAAAQVFNVTAAEGTVTFENITVKNTNAAMNASAVALSGGKAHAVFTNAVLDTSGAGKNSHPLFIGASSDGSDTTYNVTATGSAFKADTQGYAIQLIRKAELNISGSTLEGWAAVYTETSSSNASITIEQSKINGKAPDLSGMNNRFGVFALYGNYTKLTVENSTIDVSRKSNSSQSIYALLIFNSNNSKRCETSLRDNTITIGEKCTFSTGDGSMNNATASVSGGSINVPLNSKYIGSGSLAMNADGTYTVSEEPAVVQITHNYNNYYKFASLAQAFAAAESYDTITLLANTTLNEQIKLQLEGYNTASLTFDLNGKTLTVGAGLGNTSAIWVGNGYTFTLEDSAGGGIIDGTDMDDESVVLSAMQAGAKVVIEGGTIKVDTAKESCVFVKDGTLTIDGGAFINECKTEYAYKTGSAALAVNVNDSNTSGQHLIINGGTFVGRNPLLGDTNSNVTGSYMGSNVQVGLNAEGEFVAFTGSVPEGVASVYGLDESGALTVTVYTAEALAAALKEAAFADDTAATVILGKDITADVTVAEGREVTLDLGGHKLTNSGTAAGSHTIVNYGTLTVTGNGTVDNTVHNGGALVNYGVAILSGGTFTRSQEAGANGSANGNSWYTLKNYGHLTIEEGTTVTTRLEDEAGQRVGTNSSLIANGYQNDNDHTNNSGKVTANVGNNATIVIKGGTFSGGLNTVKNDEGGVATISGGTFTNVTQATVMNWNELTISGGTFNVKDDAVIAVVSGCFTSDIGSSGKTTITDGTFYGSITVDGAYGADVTYAISGGDFSVMPDYTYFKEGYAATWDEDSEMYVTAQGDWAAVINDETAYATLGEALAAAKDGDTVMLLNDIELASGSAVKAPSLGIALTIDLNGHTITSADGYSAVFDITTTKSFTLTSSKEGAAIEAAYALRLRGSGTGEVAIAVENIAFSGAYVFNSPLTFGRSNTTQVSVTLRNVHATYTDNLKNMQSFLLNADRLASLQVTGSTITVSSTNAEKAQGAYAVNLIATEAAFTDSTIAATGTLARGIYSHNFGTVISALTLNNTAVTAKDIAIESSYADLTVNGGTVTSNASAAVLFFGHMTPESAAAAIDTQEGYQTLTVTGGAQISGYTFGIGGNAAGTYDGTVMNIEDAVITGGEEAPGVFQPHVGILNIGGENTKITGSSGVVVRAGRLNITGGTFIATYATLNTVEGSGSVIDGAAVAVSHHSSNQPLTVSITGGTFNGVYSVYEDTLLSGPDPAKVSVSLAGGVYNGEIGSENVKNFITGGSFAVRPADKYFGEDFTAQYEGGYYVPVYSTALKEARIAAQTDVRAYAATLGFAWADIEAAAAEGSEEAKLVLKTYNAIAEAASTLAVAEAKEDAFAAVEAYDEAVAKAEADAAAAFESYKAEQLKELKALAADDVNTADVDESVVLPTATWFALNNAETQEEFDEYLANAKAEIEAIRSLRTEISGQTQQLADLADALTAMSEGLFGDTESGTDGAFAELFDKVQTAISDAQNAIVNGSEEGSTSLASLQKYLADEIKTVVDSISRALTDTETGLEAIKEALDTLDVSDQLADEFKKVTDAIIAAQDAITGSTGGEGGTSIGEAISQINSNTTTLVSDLREALIGENGTLTQVAAAVQGLTDLNIGGEFDGVLTAITNAQNAIMGVTEEDADGVNLSEVLGAVGDVNLAVTDALATMNETLAEWQQTVADYAETLAGIETALGDGSLYDRINTAIIAAQDAIMGSTGGEGGTSIGAAVSDLKTELSAVQKAIIDAMPNYSDQLTTISRNIEALQTLLNGNNGLAAIKKELDGVVSAIGSATSGDTSASGLFALLEAIQSGNSTIESAVTAVQKALLGTNNNGALAAITGALKEAQNDLDSLTGALLEANGGLATDITDALAAIDQIAAAIGSLGTGEGNDLATQIGGIVSDIEAVQGAVDEIGSNLGVAVDIEETKTNAVADLEVWLNAYLDTLLGTTTDEAESGVVMLAVTLETEDGDLYGRLTQAYSEANAQLILKYYNQALTAIDNATSTTDVSTAVSTFRAQVASVDAAAQNTPSMTGVYVLLAIVLVVLIAASIVVILKNRKAAAVAAQPAAEAAAEEKPAEEAKPEAAEEAAEEGSETEESAEAEKPEAEEELAADDDDKEQVVIAANVRSFAEAYVELSDEQRELFNKVKEYALGKEGTSEAKLSSGVCVKLGSKQVVKLAVRRGNPVALFVLENEMLKDFRRGAATQAKLKVRATELVLREEADLETAYTMVDLSVDQIKKDAEAAKERRREQRRERRKQRLAEEAARQAEHDGSED